MSNYNPFTTLPPTLHTEARHKVKVCPEHETAFWKDRAEKLRSILYDTPPKPDFITDKNKEDGL